VGEQLEATAIRETYEETGYKIELLPLQLTTLATLHGNDDFRSAIPGGATEPVVVTQRMAQGVLKIILIGGCRMVGGGGNWNRGKGVKDGYWSYEMAQVRARKIRCSQRRVRGAIVVATHNN
jgi:hypothetical protein